jgi:hypothetical protein
MTTETTTEAEPKAEAQPTSIADALKLAELREFSRRIFEKRLRAEDASEAAKRAKKALEAEQDQLEDFLRRMDDPMQARLPLADPEANGQADPEPDPADESDEWRSVALVGLMPYGLTAALIGKLADASIETIGQLVDYTADGKKRLIDIRGIGEGKALTISDALAAWWKDYLGEQQAALDESVTEALHRVENGQAAPDEDDESWA